MCAATDAVRAGNRRDCAGPTCGVVQRKENADIDDEATQTAYFDWLIDRAIAFDKVFGPLVKKFKEE